VGVGLQNPPLFANPLVSLGYGILPSKKKKKKNRDCILAREYIDFVELPLAKGKPPPVTPHTRRKHHPGKCF